MLFQWKVKASLARLKLQTLGLLQRNITEISTELCQPSIVFFLCGLSLSMYNSGISQGFEESLFVDLGAPPTVHYPILDFSLFSVSSGH